MSNGYRAADAHLWGGLMASWLLSLEAEGKSPATLENYRYAAVQLAEWLTERAEPDDVATLTPDQLRAWLSHLARTRSDETARSRYVGLRQFLSWCIAEGELRAHPLANVRQPVVSAKVTPMLSTEQLRTLIADCRGNGFGDLRDYALVLFMFDTGCRRGEVAGMRLDDVDLRERTATVLGKGKRPRTVAFGAKTAQALDRYLRARRRERYSDGDWLWLGSTGKGRLTGNGVYQAVARRGRRLGFHVHPHVFRHGFANAWLQAGGSETDLMELAGWRSRQMVGRYAAANRAQRAREAHRRLSPMDTL